MDTGDKETEAHSEAGKALVYRHWPIITSREGKTLDLRHWKTLRIWHRTDEHNKAHINRSTWQEISAHFVPRMSTGKGNSWQAISIWDLLYWMMSIIILFRLLLHDKSPPPEQHLNERGGTSFWRVIAYKPGWLLLGIGLCTWKHLHFLWFHGILQLLLLNVACYSGIFWYKLTIHLSDIILHIWRKCLISIWDLFIYSCV